MSTTTISVIVTCHNYQDFVTEAVDSVLAQTHPATQIVVVDDGSTDDSADRLRQRYGSDPRVTLVFVENGGQLSAFQCGMARATGQVVAFLDADDRWGDRYLERISAFYDAHREIDFVYSNLCLFGNETDTVGYADREMDLGYTVVCTFMLGHWYGAPTSALSMRAQWARRTLDLPADQAAMWRICADMCLVLGASILGARKYYLPTDAVQYRVHGNNGWYGQRSAAARFVNRFRMRCLTRFYAHRIGLTDWCLEDVKYEYKTKPNPSMRETRRYAALSMKRPGSFLKNLERALAIFASGWRNRRDAPVERRIAP